MTNLGPSAGRGRLPVQQRDRRPALAALALLLVVAGALGSALIAYRSGDRFDVLTVQRDVTPGHRMVSSDFGVSRIAGSSAGLVKASNKPNFVGSYSLTTLPAGALINAQMFTKTSVLPKGAEVVGVQLAASQRPTQTLTPNDLVRIYLAPVSSTAAATSSSVAAGTVLVTAARLVSVTSGDGSSGTGAVGISILLNSSDSATVLPLAAQNQIGVSLLPLGTTPSIDFLAN